MRKLKKTEKIFIRRLVDKFASENEVTKLVLFGSFLTSEQANDLDLAVFQNSNADYLSLALKYRRLSREILDSIPVDIIPIKNSPKGPFLKEILNGEVIFER